MKILFICSSLEPKQDGVGDYTRKLAQVLINSGHEARIIALNDRRMTGDVWEGKQMDDGTGINALRLSESMPWNLRLQKAKKFADEFNADWTSLQFVPFGYQIKGLPFKLCKKLLSISKNARWHIMFHELSVNKDASFKFFIWGSLQEMIIKSILKNLKPVVISTNTEVYKISLQKLGYTASVLPLFSNVQRTQLDVEEDHWPGKIPADIHANRGNYLMGTLFGSFTYKTWNLHSLLDKLSKNQSKDIIIASIGKMSSGAAYWQTLKAQYPSIHFLDLSMQDADFISYWLYFYTDFGILTTLPELSGKSGSFMAFKEHGIPVLCKEPGDKLTSFNIKLDSCLTVVSDDDKPLIIPDKFQPVSLLHSTTKQFIHELENS